MYTLPQRREGVVTSAKYRAKKKVLEANIKWSVESTDARDEIQRTVDRKSYRTYIPGYREFKTHVKWSAEAPDARDELRELVHSRRKQPISSPDRLPDHLHYLPTVEFDFFCGSARVPRRVFAPCTAYPVDIKPGDPNYPWDWATAEWALGLGVPQRHRVRNPDEPLERYALPPPPYTPHRPNMPLEGLVGRALNASYTGQLDIRDILEYISTAHPFYIIPDRRYVGKWPNSWMRWVKLLLDSCWFEKVLGQRWEGAPCYEMYRINPTFAPVFEGGGLHLPAVSVPLSIMPLLPPPPQQYHHQQSVVPTQVPAVDALETKAKAGGSKEVPMKRKAESESIGKRKTRKRPKRVASDPRSDIESEDEDDRPWEEPTQASSADEYDHFPSIPTTAPWLSRMKQRSHSRSKSPTPPPPTAPLFPRAVDIEPAAAPQVYQHPVKPRYPAPILPPDPNSTIRKLVPVQSWDARPGSSDGDSDG